MLGDGIDLGGRGTGTVGDAIRLRLIAEPGISFVRDAMPCSCLLGGQSAAAVSLESNILIHITEPSPLKALAAA